MSWIQTVLRLAEPPTPDMAETPALARRSLRQVDETAWLSLREAKQDALADKVKLTLVQPPDLYDYLADDDLPVAGDYELRIAKDQVAGELRFIDARAAQASAVASPADFESARALRVADVDEPIADVLGLSIVPWEGAVAETTSQRFGIPAKTVRDYAKAPTVPSNISTWLSADNATVGLHPFFGSLATQRLALSLPSSVEGEPLHLIARLEGKIKAKSRVEAVDDPVWRDADLYRILNEACLWLYGEPKETSNKHALLTGEIARAWTDGSWGAGLSRSLEDALVSAQVAYRLHLQEKGVDALKLMADLRKGVAEDVRGVSNQISALSAALWRDAAVALGTVALRNTGAVSDWVTFLVAIYLAVGGYLTLRWADQTVAAIGENELAFRRSLYKPLLTDSTYKELALDRYREVFREFRAFWRMIACIYLAAIAVVLGTVGIPLLQADAGGSLSFLQEVFAWLQWLAARIISKTS